MTASTFVLSLADGEATGRFGAALALALKPGEIVGLEGDLGAGKTTLARAAIRALAGHPDLDVPSPTFTLAQAYATTPPVLHLDLYRLGAPSELEELGLDEALETGIALVEWPERGGDALPEPTLRIELTHDGDGRRATLAGDPDALGRVSRSLAIHKFLADAGRGDAQRAFLLGDASTRAYETVGGGNDIAILMNAPKRPDGPPIRDGKPYSQIARLAETVTPFVGVAKALTSRGYAAPEIYGHDLDAGLVLIEHLGADGVLDPDGRPVPERYQAAAELLADMHGRRWDAEVAVADGIVHTIPAYDRDAMLIETELLLDWYLPSVTGIATTEADRRDWREAWGAVIDRLDRAEKSIVLRDFHSPNIIWRGDRTGHDRLGIIDFQDALIGPAAYDVASLALDARVTIDPALEAAVKATYIGSREAAGAFDRSAFEEAYAIMAAQRNSKILGIFVRLNERDGKPAYLKHLPRIRDYLGRVLGHEALAPLRPIYRRAGLVA